MMSATCLHGLTPETYRPHTLHSPQWNWPETNCYVDLWIEVLNSMGLPPEAGLGFTVMQDFEGDQFTFFKFPPEDLAALFNLSVQELAIYDRVEGHAIEQLRRGRLVLVEVDSFYLPDTQGTSYRATHGKTTVAVNYLDPDARVMHYFHNAGYFALGGNDYDGIFRASVEANSMAALFPYVEFVKRGKRKPERELRAVALNLMREHIHERPSTNPIRAYQEAFLLHAASLSHRPMEFFHLYAFNTLRQLGANFELLASHLGWLRLQGESGLEDAIAASNEIAAGAKTSQFQLARAVTRKRFDKFENTLDPVAQAYDKMMNVLVGCYAQ